MLDWLFRKPKVIYVENHDRINEVFKRLVILEEKVKELEDKHNQKPHVVLTPTQIKPKIRTLDGLKSYLETRSANIASMKIKAPKPEDVK